MRKKIAIVAGLMLALAVFFSAVGGSAVHAENNALNKHLQQIDDATK